MPKQPVLDDDQVRRLLASWKRLYPTRHVAYRELRAGGVVIGRARLYRLWSETPVKGEGRRSA